jgi:hypothetical protein
MTIYSRNRGFLWCALLWGVATSVGASEVSSQTSSGITSTSSDITSTSSDVTSTGSPESIVLASDDSSGNKKVGTFAGRGITRLEPSLIDDAGFTRDACREMICLDLSNNEITTLDGAADFFALFPQLEMILLSGNSRLERLSPDSLVGLSELKTVIVTECRLREISDDFFQRLAGLEKLDVSHNELEALAPVASHARLKELIASDNALTQIPDVRSARALIRLDVSNNSIEDCAIERLPRSQNQEVSVRFFSCAGNAIARLSARVLQSFRRGIIDLSRNPVWDAAGEEEIRAADFSALPFHAQNGGRVGAESVRSVIARDVGEKCGSFLVNSRALAAPVVLEEVKRHRALDAISTTAIDMGMLCYKYGAWVWLGVIIVTGGVGAGVGAIFHKIVKDVAMKQAKRALIGAGIGAAVGALVSVAGYKCFYKDDYFYCDRGGARVHMTSKLKALYLATSRLLAMLSLLKQYIVACSVSLDWIVHFEEYAGRGDRIAKLVSDLEAALHAGVEGTLSRVDDPTTIALLYTLLETDPISGLSSYAAPGVFSDQPLDEQGLLDDGVTYPWISRDTMVLLKGVLSDCASASRAVRCLLLNSYIHGDTARDVYRFIERLEPMKDALRTIDVRIVTPLKSMIDRAGWADHEWGGELAHLQTTTRRTHKMLCDLNIDRTLMSRMSR